MPGIHMLTCSVYHQEVRCNVGRVGRGCFLFFVAPRQDTPKTFTSSLKDIGSRLKHPLQHGQIMQ